MNGKNAITIRDNSATKKYLKALLYFSVVAGGTSPLDAASFTVTNNNDSGSGSFRAAIISANGAGSNTITFTAPFSGTITLASSLPVITSHISTIDTNGNSVTINGSGLYSAFYAVGPSFLAIENSMGGSSFSLINTASIGASGSSNGAGGALGAGGGIFVGNNSFTALQGVSFSNCHATGGAGAAASHSSLFSGGVGGRITKTKLDCST